MKDVSRVRRLPCDGASGRDLLLIGLADVRILRVKPTGGAAVLETFARDIAGKLDAVVADFDNDKAYEVLVVATSELRLFRGSVSDGFRPDELTPFRSTDLTHSSGGEVMDAAAYDADHDGDLDVIVISTTNDSLEARLLVNNGDRSFTRHASYLSK